MNLPHLASHRIAAPLGILVAFLTLFTLAFKTNPTPQNLLWSDMEGYYVYLPATFIYGGFRNGSVQDTNYIRPWPGTDRTYTKYTYGVALMEAPFFLLAHLASRPLGYASDGHSLIYCYGIMGAGIFYLLAGLYLLWRTIRRWYGAVSAATALSGLFLGTNLYYYTLVQSGMSHVYSFFLYAVMVYLTERILEPRAGRNHFLVFGLVAGLIVLTRPTGTMALLYPVYRWYRQGGGAAFYRQHASNLVWAAIPAALLWLPQLFYWHWVSGQWMAWSYGEETFKYWKEPKLFRVLFDAWNGWLLYSPIAMIPLLWLILKRHDNRHSERAILYILAMATYLFASWWAWWFGGAFGHRCYVEYYALLAIPFAAVAEAAYAHRYVKFLFPVLCALLIYYNLGLTYHYQAPWDGPGWTYEQVWLEVKKLY